MKSFLFSLTLFFCISQIASAAQPWQLSQCDVPVVQTNPWSGQSGCKRIGRYDYHLNSWSEMTYCHFENDVSVDIFDQNLSIRGDIKGLSQIVFENFVESQENHQETFRTCHDLLNRIHALRSLKPFTLPKVGRKSFSHKDGVTLVASDATCDIFSNAFEALLRLLASEGRQGARLCVPNAIVAQKNPSTIRDFIKSKSVRTQGILLVGNDIPPFEVLSRGTGGIYDVGHTDTPYGELQHGFWSRGISKETGWVRGPVYKDNGTYPVTRPSLWAFDLDQFLASEIKLPASKRYVQRHWVARWMGDANAFQRYLQRRQSYRPVEKRVFFHGVDQFTFPFEPGRFYDVDAALYRHVSDSRRGGTYRAYVQTSLESLTAHFDDSINLASLFSHGNTDGMQGFDSLSLRNVNWLPEIVNSEGCLTGAWGYSPGLEKTMVHAVLERPQAPLALIAPQAVTSYPTVFSHNEKIIADRYIMDWPHGQALGQRQIGSFNKNLTHVVGLAQRDSLVTGRAVLQTFIAHSIFGDGTVEW